MAGFLDPNRTRTIAVAKPLPPVVAVVPPQPTFIPYYDPSRIIKNIRVVADLRQQGTERGEVQTGDNGTLGPGSIAPPRTNGGAVAPPVTEKNVLIPIALAIGTFILLGG